MHKIIKFTSHTVLINDNRSIIYGSIEMFVKIQRDLLIIIRCFIVEHTKIFCHTKTKRAIEHIILIKASDDLTLIKYNNNKSITQLIKIENYVC